MTCFAIILHVFSQLFSSFCSLSSMSRNRNGIFAIVLIGFFSLCLLSSFVSFFGSFIYYQLCEGITMACNDLILFVCFLHWGFFGERCLQIASRYNVCCTKYSAFSDIWCIWKYVLYFKKCPAFSGLFCLSKCIWHFRECFALDVVLWIQRYVLHFQECFLLYGMSWNWRYGAVARGDQHRSRRRLTT